MTMMVKSTYFFKQKRYCFFLVDIYPGDNISFLTGLIFYTKWFVNRQRQFNIVNLYGGQRRSSVVEDLAKKINASLDDVSVREFIDSPWLPTK